MSNRAHRSRPEASARAIVDRQSSAAKLWAKTPDRFGTKLAVDDITAPVWLSLVQHCRDSADVADDLARTWLPNSLQARLVRGLALRDLNEMAKMLAWIAGTHDTGKAEVLFQSQIAGNPDTSYLWDRVRLLPETAGLQPDTINRLPHSAYSELILRRWLSRSFPHTDFRAIASVAAIAGCHHGRPSGLTWQQSRYFSTRDDRAEAWLDKHGDPWAQMWWDILDDITARTESREVLDTVLCAGGLAVTDQILLAGFVSMCDWIASNQSLFPLTTTGLHDSTESRAANALTSLGLTEPWDPERPENIDFRQRFGWPNDAQLRPSQEAAMRIAARTDGPTMLVIEDETGRGKTEAAQLAGEILAARSGAGGLAFALPSMTTTDAMLPRLLRWTQHLESGGPHSIRLMHSRAALNSDFEKLVRATRHVNEDSGDAKETTASGPESTIAHAWFSGRKGVLSEFLVCTVDQILMLALATRYVTMRHLGLAGKVIVIDEVHSYDVYTSGYLAQALTWLAAQGASVILLSATLASGPRHDLIEAYRGGLVELPRPGHRSAPTVAEAEAHGASGAASGAQARTDEDREARRERRRRERAQRREQASTDITGSRNSEQALETAFPRITAVTASGTSAEHVPAPTARRDVHVSIIDDDDPTLIGTVEQLAAEGGIIGVVCNTVSRAQQAAIILSRRFPGSVDLLHSQFVAADRARKEAALTQALGATSSVADGTRPRLRIIVGTQVIEQSLDIDLDALISDLAPTDSLAQRAGRLHRHTRDRPPGLCAAQLILRGADLSGETPVFDPGSVAVYGERVLLATAAILQRYLGSKPWCVRHDLSADVEETYSAEWPGIPASWADAYAAAAKKEQQKRRSAITRAGAFQLTAPLLTQARLPEALKAMTGSDPELSDTAAQASVRDIEPSLEACLVQQTADGLMPLQWLLTERDRGIAVSEMSVPPYRLAAAIADSAVRLPRRLVPPDRLDEAIAELERFDVRGWQDDYRLRGQLILPVDEQMRGAVLGRAFVYDKEAGIVAEADTPVPQTWFGQEEPQTDPEGGTEDDNVH